MSQVVGEGDVLDGDVVGDDKLFKSGVEGFAENEIGFDEEGVGCGGDVEIGFESAFGGNDGGADGMAWEEFLYVLGNLAVEEAEAVGASEAEEGTGAREPSQGG